jgi:hypothetical protein
MPMPITESSASYFVRQKTYYTSEWPINAIAISVISILLFVLGGLYVLGTGMTIALFVAIVLFGLAQYFMPHSLLTPLAKYFHIKRVAWLEYDSEGIWSYELDSTISWSLIKKISLEFLARSWRTAHHYNFVISLNPLAKGSSLMAETNELNELRIFANPFGSYDETQILQDLQSALAHYQTKC